MVMNDGVADFLEKRGRSEHSLGGSSDSIVNEEHNGQPTLSYFHCQVLLSREDPVHGHWILPDLSSLVLLVY